METRAQTLLEGEVAEDPLNQTHDQEPTQIRRTTTQGAFWGEKVLLTPRIFPATLLGQHSRLAAKIQLMLLIIPIVHLC
jgi:hypothetical protein